MRELRQWLRREPLSACAVMMVVYQLCNNGCSLLLRALPEGGVWAVLRLVIDLLWPAALAVMGGYGWVLWHRGLWRTLRVGGLLFFLMALAFGSTLVTALAEETPPWLPPSGILLGAASLLVRAFQEEVVFRGILCNAIGERYLVDTRGVWFTAIVSGAVFGAMHLFNILGGMAPLSALVQAVVAWAMGAVFAAVYLRGGNLWAVVLIHALMNANSLFSATFTSADTPLALLNRLTAANLAPLMLFLPLLVWLLRPSRCRRVVAVFARRRGQRTPGLVWER